MFAHRVMIMSAASLALSVCAGSRAEMIELIHETIASGTIGQLSFGQAAPVAIKITAFGDTDDIDSSITAFHSLNHTFASIEIEGLGTFEIFSNTRTFVSNTSNAVGFSRGSLLGLDLLTGPQNGEFHEWDLRSSIGPLSGNGRILQWASEPVMTSGGLLRLFNNSNAQVTFTAIVFPAPGTIVLAGIACFGLRRRR